MVINFSITVIGFPHENMGWEGVIKKESTEQRKMRITRSQAVPQLLSCYLYPQSPNSTSVSP